jgi:hypothetical protein
VAADAEASTPLPDQSLLYLGIRRDRIDVRADRDSTLFLLGGEPFESDIVMWWNFVGRTHEEIVAARDAWEDRRAPPSASAIVGHGDERVPAPPLPAVRLTPRRRPAPEVGFLPADAPRAPVRWRRGPEPDPVDARPARVRGDRRRHGHPAASPASRR